MASRPLHPASRVNPLTGRFFLAFNDNVLERQGHIIGEVSNGHFLCQFYDSPTAIGGVQETVHVARMKGWQFFTRRGDWLAAYEEYSRRQGGGK
jgi:hypothetical protein